MHEFMIDCSHQSHLTLHACDFAFGDCMPPHLPDAGWRKRGAERLLSAVPENEFFQSEMRAEPDAFSGQPDEQTMD